MPQRHFVEDRRRQGISTLSPTIRRSSAEDNTHRLVEGRPQGAENDHASRRIGGAGNIMLQSLSRMMNPESELLYHYFHYNNVARLYCLKRQQDVQRPHVGGPKCGFEGRSGGAGTRVRVCCAPGGLLPGAAPLAGQLAAAPIVYY